MKTNRGQLALGIILILLGAWFVLQRQVPAFSELLGPYMEWPYSLVLAGAVILVVGLLLGATGLAVPAAVVAGIGGILVYQQQTGSYDSWSYMWALIPGFVGAGNVIAGLLGGGRHQLRSGLNLVVVSAVLFLVFASIFGELTFLGAFGPAVLLILLGIWLVARGLIRRSSD